MSKETGFAIVVTAQLLSWARLDVRVHPQGEVTSLIVTRVEAGEGQGEQTVAISGEEKMEKSWNMYFIK